MTHDTFTAEDHPRDANGMLLRPGSEIPVSAMPDPFRAETLTELTAEIVGSYVAHNSVAASAPPDLIRSVHAALAGLGKPVTAEAPAALVPAVPVRKSVHEDYIVSLLDGRKFKSLKRHIGVAGYTLESYRAAFGLPPDYPMVCASYAAKRSALAKEIGLGNMRKRSVG